MKIKGRFFASKVKGKTGVELFKYSIIGGIGFSLNLILLYFLTEFFGIYYLVSAALASVVSGLTIFSLDKVWTFQENLEKNFFGELVFFFVFGVVGLAVRIGLLYFFTTVMGVYYLISQTFAILIIGIFTFTCNEIWTFSSVKKKLK